MKTRRERVYDYLVENPNATNEEIEEALNIPSEQAKIYIHRLVKANLIEYKFIDGIRHVNIIDEYADRRHSPRLNSDNPRNDIYEEMLDIYMEDFRNCESFQTRVKVGQEIRLLMKEM